MINSLFLHVISWRDLFLALFVQHMGLEGYHPPSRDGMRGRKVFEDSETGAQPTFLGAIGSVYRMKGRGWVSGSRIMTIFGRKFFFVNFP